ncbi:MAG: 1-acyl-sn-glycerol-3-phosphate acyltransferase, partial [Pseudomonadota bacterium]
MNRKILEHKEPGRVRRFLLALIFQVAATYIFRKVKEHLEYFLGSVNVPKTGGLIIVPNHQSYFDSMVITTLVLILTGRRTLIPTNIKAYTGWFTNLYQEATGAYPIDPKDREGTYQRLKGLLEQGKVIILFPEGTRSDGSGLLPFKFGAFNLAAELGMPILPVGIRNAARILPKGSLRFRKGETGSLVFGEVVRPPNPQGRSADEIKETAAELRNQVRDWIDETVHGDAIQREGDEAFDRELTALAARAEEEIELILDRGVENVVPDDTTCVLRMADIARIFQRENVELRVQHLRAFGFRVSSLPQIRGLWHLSTYRRLLREALAKDPEHPFLTYSLGQFHLKVPSIVGGGDLQEAVRALRSAFERAPDYGMKQERFAFGYATGLAKIGREGEAIEIIERFFAGPERFEGRRRLRRRERALAFSATLRTRTGATPAWSDLPTRPLRGFELVMAQSRIADVIVAEVEGEMDLGRLRRAAASLQVRHPGLRARVEWPDGRSGRPIFRYGPPDPDRLVLFEVREENEATADRPLWQVIAEREANHRFDLSAGYMFRIAWITTREGAHLLLNVQHSLVDGVSLMRLVHDLLGLYERTAEPQDISPLMPTAAVLEQAPSLSLLEKLVGKVAKEVGIRRQRRFHEYSPLPIHARLGPSDLETRCRFAEGDAQNWGRVRSACKARGVTVGGAYAAAIQCALLHEMGLSNRRTKAWMSMDFSLRRMIDGSTLDQESVGLFSGVGDLALQVDPGETFWDFARRWMDASRKQIQMKAPLIFHQVFDSVWNLEASMHEYRFDCVESGGSADVVSMSNVGAYPYPTQVGHLALKSVYGMSGSQLGGP